MYHTRILHDQQWFRESLQPMSGAKWTTPTACWRNEKKILTDGIEGRCRPISIDIMEKEATAHQQSDDNDIETAWQKTRVTKAKFKKRQQKKTQFSSSSAFFAAYLCSCSQLFHLAFVNEEHEKNNTAVQRCTTCVSQLWAFEEHIGSRHVYNADVGRDRV